MNTQTLQKLSKWNTINWKRNQIRIIQLKIYIKKSRKHGSNIFSIYLAGKEMGIEGQVNWGATARTRIEYVHEYGCGNYSWEHLYVSVRMDSGESDT